MADTSVLEVARLTHEEIERLEQAAVDLLIANPRVRLTTSHQLSALLDRLVARKEFLRTFYADPTGDRAKEFGLLTHPSETDNDTFKKRMDKIQSFHTKYPQAPPGEFDLDLLPTNEVERLFSGEEMLGKYVDLYVQHEAWCNLRGVRKVPYILYLETFDELLRSVPVATKKTEAYRSYLSSVHAYLDGFLRRTQPLRDIDTISQRVEETFGPAWDNGKIEGWSRFGPVALSSTNSTTTNTNQASTSTASEQGIWCDACHKLFAKQTVYEAHIKSPKHLKAVARLEAVGKSDSTPMQTDTKWRAVAQLEAYVVAFATELAATRTETRINLERRAALTERERQAEAEAASRALEEEPGNPMADIGEEEQEEGERLYNPLKLPLGWDGKPIPFWLYKLHGLGVEYRCQICSDYVYQGRRAFERHFHESRHAFGMRALGLPNTKHFYEITQIADALALAEKLRQQGRALTDEQYDAEEVEDEAGNAYSRKTYEMMRRQGLL